MIYVLSRLVIPKYRAKFALCPVHERIATASGLSAPAALAVRCGRLSPRTDSPGPSHVARLWRRTGLTTNSRRTGYRWRVHCRGLYQTPIAAWPVRDVGPSHAPAPCEMTTD